jgi:hypothetical protein
MNKIAQNSTGAEVRGQDIIVTRAHTATTLYWKSYYEQLVDMQASDERIHAQLMNVMKNTRKPVMLYLAQTGDKPCAHAVREHPQKDAKAK